MPLPPENPEFVPQHEIFSDKDIEKAINDLWKGLYEGKSDVACIANVIPSNAAPEDVKE